MYENMFQLMLDWTSINELCTLDQKQVMCGFPDSAVSAICPWLC